MLLALRWGCGVQFSEKSVTLNGPWSISTAWASLLKLLSMFVCASCINRLPCENYYESHSAKWSASCWASRYVTTNVIKYLDPTPDRRKWHHRRYQEGNTVHGWAGHIARFNDNRCTITVTEWRPIEWTRWQGWPKTRWRDNLILHVEPVWPRIARDRLLWRQFREGFLLMDWKKPWC